LIEVGLSAAKPNEKRQCQLTLALCIIDYLKKYRM